MASIVDQLENIQNSIEMRSWECYANEVVDYSSNYNYSNSFYYAPSNLVGRYEKYPSYGDFPETYCLRSYGNWWKKSESYQSNYRPQDYDPLGAEDYVTVRFEENVLPRHICIYEVYNPGAVVRIWGKLINVPEKQWIVLWEGEPQTFPHKSRKFIPPIKAVNYLIDTIRLEFNQSHLEYHCSIDAVLLGGLQPTSPMICNIMLKSIELRYSPEEPLHQIAEPNVDVCEDFFSTLPVEVITHIFQKLDIISLIKCSQVNRSWNEIASDPLLYQSLNLKPYWYLVNSDTLRYFMKKCKSLRKLDLSWCGNDVYDFVENVAKLLAMHSNTLTHLSMGNCSYLNHKSFGIVSSCTELVDLRLKNSSFDPRMISLDTLNKLVSLDLTASLIQDFELIKILKYNPHLKHIIIDLCEKLIHLDHVVQVLSECNKQITCWSSWKTLSLTADGIRHFGNCPNLKELDLGWCLIGRDPGDCLNDIARGCPKLQRLILSEWRGLNDNLVMTVIMSCRELTQLDFLGIKNISGEVCKRALMSLPNLELLEISFCDSVRQEDVVIWRQKYPHVTIQRSCQFTTNEHAN